MSFNYDEDLYNNPLFQEIQKHHTEILEKATKEGCIICIPRIGSLDIDNVPLDCILEHVLVPNEELLGTHYCTLTKKEVTVLNKIAVVKDESSQSTNMVHILFEETFYINKTKSYKVWCVDHPLNQNLSVDTSVCNSISNLNDSVQLLWSNNGEVNNLQFIDTEARNFIERHDLTCVNVEILKKLVEGLYLQCSTAIFKYLHSSVDKTVMFSKNVKLAVETYLQHCLHVRLFSAICDYTSNEDAHFNKLLRNLSDLQLKHLTISKELHEFIPCAKRELSKINHFTSVLGKVECLKETLNILSRDKTPSKIYHVTSDDLIQIFAFLITKLMVNNWIANLTYISQFRFSSVNLSDENAFVVVTLEAAVEFIKGGIDFERPRKCGLKTGIFECVKRGSVEDFKVLLLQNKSKPRDLSKNRCHPLCSCDNCEEVRGEETKCDNKGRSLLHLASTRDNPEFVEVLLSEGADVNAQDTLSSTPLHYAARKGNHNVLLLLLQADAKETATDDEGNTPLHLSANNGHEKCVKAQIYFTEYKSGTVNVNCANNYGNTPLHFASKWGYYSIVHLLVQHGANPVLLNKQNQKALDIAHNSYIRALLRSSVFNGNEKTSVEAVQKCNVAVPVPESSPHKSGIRPKSIDHIKRLDLAFKSIENNDLPLMCYYIGIPMPPNTTEQPPKTTTCHPLCLCEKCSLPEVEQNRDLPVFEYSESLNINTCNCEGFTALHMAAKHGRTEIVRLLLDAGALVNIRTFIDFYSPLHIACRYQRVQVVRELVQCGSCSLDDEDAYGNTPLHYTCLRNDTRIAEILLNHQASCNIKNSDGKTVWQLASEHMLFGMMKLLNEKCEKCVEDRDDGSFLFAL